MCRCTKKTLFKNSKNKWKHAQFVLCSWNREKVSKSFVKVSTWMGRNKERELVNGSLPSVLHVWEGTNWSSCQRQDIRICLSTRFLERLLHKRKVWESFSPDRWKERADEARDETRCFQNFLSTAGNNGIKVVEIEILEDLDHKLRLKLTLSVLWRWYQIRLKRRKWTS